jgi:uncharacterized protein (DUF58 family)
MLSDELLKKVRYIEITTRKAVDEVVSGQYKSHFRGQGVQFSEHRPYVPGDDVRHINWNVSARTKEPLVKQFDEERELTVFLVVDISGSEYFGSSEKLKSEIAAEIGGMLAYAASHTGDKVGLLIFAGETELIIPAKKGRHHILRIIRELLAHAPRTQGTDLAGALESTGRIMKHSGVVFIISDFLASDYATALRRLSRKHDVVAVHIGDQREDTIPELGQILLYDPETGRESLVDTSSYSFKKWFESQRKIFDADRRATFKTGRVETVNILTHEDYGDAVARFFRARSKKRR